jgi:protein SCO1
MNTLKSGKLTQIALVASWLLLAAFASAQSNELPANARGIDVEDRVGDFIPLELMFQDERGIKVPLRKYFEQRPVILTLNYSDCPGLCIAQLDQLVETLRKMKADGLGRDYTIVTVSIDPNETSSQAARTKAKYVGMLRNTEADEHWHFLTGGQREISRLADSVGFRYTYDKANNRYNHPAVTYFIAPNGRLCRYLLSLGVEPEQLKLAVAEANAGKLTFSLADAFIQFCYLYDPEANRYTASAKRLMAFGGAAFALLLTGCTAPFWFSGRRAQAARAAENVDPAAKGPSLVNGSVDPQVQSYNDGAVFDPGVGCDEVKGGTSCRD